MGKNHLSFDQFAIKILEALNQAQIEYMIGGAVAVWAWGEPRTTQDLDMVIRIRPEQAAKLSEALEKIEIYLPSDIILDNLLETRADLPLNAIHGASGFKAEFFTLDEGDVLRSQAFQRKKLVDFGQPIGKVFVHSPEDLILYKMIYFSISEQPKHVRDIGSILKAMGERVDRAYVTTWVNVLGLVEIWTTIIDEIDN